MFLSLINESECDFLILAFKIYLKKKKLETTMTCAKFTEIRKFLEISNTWLFVLYK